MNSTGHLTAISCRLNKVRRAGASPAWGLLHFYPVPPAPLFDVHQNETAPCGDHFKRRMRGQATETKAMELQSVLYFLLWAGLFILMMRFGCGAHVLGHGHHHANTGSRENHGPEGELSGTPPAEAVDPVCGMTVQTVGAKSAVHAGRPYYFCSPSCREKFEANPAAYVKSVPPA